MASVDELGEESFEDSSPLSSLQVGMLYQSLVAAEADPNLIQITGELREEIDPARFAAAWQRVAEQHEVLRSSFVWDGTPGQRIHRSVQVPFVYCDLTSLAPEARATSFNELLKGQQQPFDLGVAPLMRIALAKCGPADFRLVWTLHHLIADAQSFAVVLRDVFVEPQTSAPPRYRDFVRGISVRPANEDYWRRKLQALSSVPCLGKGGQHQSSECSIEIAKPVASRLRELAAANAMTLTSVLHGAWALLLSRHTGEDDLLFGVVRAGRRAEYAKTAGLFITTLPLRVRVAADLPVFEWLKEVRDAWRELRDHEHASLTDIQRCAGITGALFDTLVSVQDPPWNDTLGMADGGWKNRIFRITNRTAYAASLDVYAGETLRITLNHTAFTPDEARRIIDQLGVILETLAAQPELRACDIEILSEAEKQSLMAWNATEISVDTSRRVDELVAEQAQRAPESLAVQCGAESVTYRELNERAGRLAAQLNNAGIGPETLVAVYMERSVDLIVGLLAVLKAGGAYVPIDVTYPRNRVEYMIRDSMAGAVLTHGKLAKGLDVGAARVISLDALHSVTCPHHLPCAVGMQNLAYVIYTSGSTGQPKGVAVEHRSLLNLVQWHQRTYQVVASDRASQVASPAFDAAVWEIWPYLTAGASIHIPSEEIRTSPPRLARWLNEEAISIAFLPTPLAEAVMSEQFSDSHALRYLLTGGDQLRTRPPANTRYRLINHYGPTENTVVTTAAEVSADGAGVPAIGRPIANVRVQVLDRHSRRVPIGVAGELFVGGEGLARGYWNRPELTAERFLTRVDGQRLYRTGDLVRWQADGQIEFLGRVDNQVKIRGYRIELGEIECALRSHSSVSDAAVIAQKDDHGMARLVAYVVASDNTQPAALRDHVRESLPDYMTPDTYISLAALPLTPNGKVDRQALPRVELASMAPRYAAPRNPAEEVMAGIWSDVLKCGRVGIDDNFFNLGGHSLSSTQVISRTRKAFGTELPLNALFKFPTIRELSEQVGGGDAGEANQIATARWDKGEVPLSFSQERLWFFEQFEPGKPVNNIAFAIEIAGDLDLNALERAAREMLCRHESLRTAFEKRDGRPVGRIVPPPAAVIAQQDLTQLSESERERAARRIAEAAARDAFDLNSGNLLRLLALKLAPGRHVVVLTMHHIASDGWSMSVIYRELSELYAAEIKGVSAQLPNLPIQYGDFAGWQRTQFEQGHWKSELTYWREKLGGKIPVLDLPGDRPRPAVQAYNGAAVSFALAEDLVEQLQRLAKREDVTLFMILLAGFKALLHRYSGQEDIIVGTPVAGRTRAETEDLIGMFVNTLPLRTTMSGEMPFGELLDRVRETALGANAHQQVPFEKLVEALQIPRDLSRAPLFEVMFVLQNAPTETLSFAGADTRVRAVHTSTAKYDLTVSLEASGGALCGWVEFNSDVFDHSTIERFCGHFETLLRGVAENSETRIADLPLLTRAERRQLLEEWNATEGTYARQKCVHELFEDQVQRTPDAVAAVFEDEQLTYRQLNQKANAIALALRAAGVGPESRVGICARRSLEMLAGSLGILKAGAAYVPLDPTYPKDRLTLMIEDAQAHALLTQRELTQSLPPGAKVICLEDTMAAVEANPVSGAVPDNLAYVIYTSGSTGKPKGVMIRHRNVANFFAGMDKVLGTAPGVWLAVTSICFDISVLEMLWTVTRGFKVVIQSDQGGLRASVARQANERNYEIPEQIQRHGVTHFQCTPSLMGMLLQEKEARAVMASVGTVLLGGEALTLSLVEQLGDTSKIINMYGPTETTVWSASQLIERGQPISIGRPMLNTRIYILDRSGQPTPIGVPGELHIGGAGVVRGYFNRPELTAERFVPDPFARQPGDRMYKTGDLARFKADGTIEFLGRIDHQVKLRGFRIELGEIEAALRQVHGVREAIVVVREVNANDKRLAAYVVAEKQIETTLLRRALKEKLPDYMVPSLFTFLDKMPLTPNGKVDRQALPEPTGLKTPTSVAFVPAQNDAEQVIARIWKELLCVERVGHNDNFFDLGGHSLLMVQAQARISAAFGVDVPVIRLFQYPTVSSLAKLLGNPPKQESAAFSKIRARALLQRQAFAARSNVEASA